MNIILLITAIISSLVPVAVFFHFTKEARNHIHLKRRDFFIILIGLIYLIFSVLLFLWSINIFEFNQQDFLIVLAAVILTQTISLIAILYQSIHNKKIFYPLSIFIMLIPLILIKPSYLHLVVPISLFVTLLSFLVFADEHQKAVRNLTLYSSIALLSYLISLAWQNTITSLNLISTTLFLFFLVSFLNSLRLHPDKEAFPPHNPESPIIHYLKHFIFIIIITNFIFIGTISVHELGHLALAKSADCQDIKIVYELSGLPHTEVDCQDNSNQMKWILGGILLPFLVALLFFLSGGGHTKGIALQILGFNLAISYLDLKAIGFSDAIATFGFISGVAFTILGLALLIRTRVE